MVNKIGKLLSSAASEVAKPVKAFAKWLGRGITKLTDSKSSSIPTDTPSNITASKTDVVKGQVLKPTEATEGKIEKEPPKIAPKIIDPKTEITEAERKQVEITTRPMKTEMIKNFAMGFSEKNKAIVGKELETIFLQARKLGKTSDEDREELANTIKDRFEKLGKDFKPITNQSQLIARHLEGWLSSLDIEKLENL